MAGGMVVIFSPMLRSTLSSTPVCLMRDCV
jgi:hypothetical protein